MNNNAMFVLFYVSVISVALFASIHSSRLNAWNHVVFTFPPETQKVIVNGTATMEVWWRWTTQTLDMVIKVNDDENNKYTNNSVFIDGVGIIFDSDNSGNITHLLGLRFEAFDDRGVFLGSKVYPGTSRASFVIKHCWIDSENRIREPLAWCPYYAMATIDNTTICTFKEAEGYTFNTSIPLEYINVNQPTQVIINYVDNDYRFPRLLGAVPEVDEAFLVAQLWM